MQRPSCRGGGGGKWGYVSPWSEFQIQSCRILRSKPCPCLKAKSPVGILPEKGLNTGDLRPDKPET